MRKAVPYLIGAFCVLTLLGVAAGVWLSYDARSKAEQNAKNVAALSSDIASVQASIDSTPGGDGSAATIDDLDSEIQDLQSSIDNLDTTATVDDLDSEIQDLQSSVDDLTSSLQAVSDQVDSICFSLSNCRCRSAEFGDD